MQEYGKHELRINGVRLVSNLQQGTPNSFLVVGIERSRRVLEASFQAEYQPAQLPLDQRVRPSELDHYPPGAHPAHLGYECLPGTHVSHEADADHDVEGIAGKGEPPERGRDTAGDRRVFTSEPSEADLVASVNEYLVTGLEQLSRELSMPSSEVQDAKRAVRLSGSRLRDQLTDAARLPPKHPLAGSPSETLRITLGGGMDVRRGCVVGSGPHEGH